MEFTWFDNTTSIISFIIQGVIIVGLFGCTIYTVYKTINRKNVALLIFFLFLLGVFGFIFQLQYLFTISCLMGAMMNFFAFVSNIGDVRRFLSNPFGKSSTKSASNVQKIVNYKDLFKEVQEAVVNLSDNKIGALITFEKNSNLIDICKNGVPINAPFTKELISTIFYPGTRLHDGAVIVKDGRIAYASVFFTPTTKPFATKYGSRHRAALGISEISDAITIVVSEETGIVSIAQDGDLHHVEANYIAQTLANYF